MPKKVTGEVLDETENLRIKKLTYEEIAEKICLSLSTVGVHLELPCEIVFPLTHDIHRTS